MTPEELIEAVSKRIRTSFEWWMSDEGRFPRAIERKGDGYLLAQAQTCWDAWEASARLAVDPLLQSLISERDAALARVAELEADAKRLRAEMERHRPILESVEAHVETWAWASRGTGVATLNGYRAAINKAIPNVRDAGPTPFSGRTTRREG